MSEPSVSEMRSQAKKVNSIGRVFKDPTHGGPRMDASQMGTYDSGTKATIASGKDWMANEHPTFPDYLYPDTKNIDRYMAKKQQLANQSTTGESLGEVKAGPEDINYLLTKEDMAESAKFKSFVETSLPRGTPWAKEFFEKIQPGWYRSKEQIINEKIELLKRYFKISLHGPQSIEDMYLIYIVSTGKIELPATVEDIVRPALSAVDRKLYVSGPFSTTHLVSEQTRISERNQRFLANMSIPGIDSKYISAGDDTGHGDGPGGTMKLAGGYNTVVAQPRTKLLNN